MIAFPSRILCACLKGTKSTRILIIIKEIHRVQVVACSEHTRSLSHAVYGYKSRTFAALCRFLFVMCLLRVAYENVAHILAALHPHPVPWTGFQLSNSRIKNFPKSLDDSCVDTPDS